MKSNGVPILGDPLYSAVEDAQEEDRCYLHATALRIPIEGIGGGGKRWLRNCDVSEERSTDTLDVVLPPVFGSEFCSLEFKHAFQTHFLEDVSDGGNWFKDSKLLMSSSGWLSSADET
jgi:hypothetical protein